MKNKNIKYKMKACKYLFSICITVIIFSHAQGYEKAVIGFDERQLSNVPQVGRITLSNLSHQTCSATLIGRTCMVTAGHCKQVMNYVEFNVPHSIHGRIRFSKKRDQYKIDHKSIISHFLYPGDPDWAVFRLKKHRPISKWAKYWNRLFSRNNPIPQKYLNTDGYYAGDLQGYYDVNFTQINKLDYIRVTGFGTDGRGNGKRNQSQQTGLGFIRTISPMFAEKTFYHDVDTAPGSSGSGIINEDTNQFIGVHTHQVCPNTNEEENRIFCKNGGTGVYLNIDFAKAIQDCLDWEKENLN